MRSQHGIWRHVCCLQKETTSPLKLEVFRVTAVGSIIFSRNFNQGKIDDCSQARLHSSRRVISIAAVSDDVIELLSNNKKRCNKNLLCSLCWFSCLTVSISQWAKGWHTLFFYLFSGIIFSPSGNCTRGKMTPCSSLRPHWLSSTQAEKQEAKKMNVAFHPAYRSSLYRLSE